MTFSGFLMGNRQTINVNQIFSKSRANFWNFEGTSAKIGQKLEKIEQNQFRKKNLKKVFFSKKINFLPKIGKNHDFFPFYDFPPKCSKIANFCPNGFKKILGRV